MKKTINIAYLIFCLAATIAAGQAFLQEDYENGFDTEYVEEEEGETTTTDPPFSSSAENEMTSSEVNENNTQNTTSKIVEEEDDYELNYEVDEDDGMNYPDSNENIKKNTSEAKTGPDQLGRMGDRNVTLLQDDLCRTPEEQSGTVTTVASCKFFLDKLKNNNQLLTTEEVVFLKKYFLGENNNTNSVLHKIKVCCPNTIESRAQELPETVISESDIVCSKAEEDIGLKNLAMLPSDCGQPPIEEHTKPLGKRIFNGKETNLMTLPWMAHLYYEFQRNKYEPQCGGSLINKRYVLTAAHCVAGVYRSLLKYVVLGQHKVSEDESCFIAPSGFSACSTRSKHYIDKVTSFPSYSHVPNYYNDIALIRLKNNVKFNLMIHPICLPVNIFACVKLAKTNVLVSGWGTTENGTQSDVLMQAVIPVLTSSDCRSKHQLDDQMKDLKVKYGRQFCAGSSSDSCQGDSGGPLQLKVLEKGKTKPTTVQYGVVSYGPVPCAQNDVPGVYTRVTKFMPWIMDQLKP